MHLPHSSSRLAALALLLAAALLFAAAPANANQTYPPNPDSRSFANSVGGWTATSSFSGACTPPLVCPTVTNSFQPSGGAGNAGDGYIRSTLNGVVGLQAVAGTSTAVWSSPAFTYQGIDGRRPNALRFSLSRRADVAEILAVAGNSATYSVALLDQSAGGTSTTIVEPTSLAGATDWTTIQGVSISPADLALNHQYVIAITVSYVTGTGVLVSGSADFDNVRLLAVDAEAGSGKGGSPSVSATNLKRWVLAAAPRTAQVVYVKGQPKFLRVKVRCPRVAPRACSAVVQGKLRRKGRSVTSRRGTLVKPGTTKSTTLRIRPRFANKVAKRKRLLIKQRTRVGKVRVVTFQKRRLTRAST